MLKISKDRITEIFNTVAESKSLYLPVNREDGQAEFKKYENGMVLSENLNTLRSAKDFFFPQTENLVDFKMEGKNIEVIDLLEKVGNEKI